MSTASSVPSSDHVHILEERILSDDWYQLRKTRFEYRRRDDHWQELIRQTYDRGNGAVLLLFNIDRATVILTRQL